MAYTSLTDLNVVTVLSNIRTGDKQWVPVENTKLEGVKGFKEEMSYVRLCAEKFGVNWEEAKNTYLLKADNGVVQKVYAPRIQTNVEGQIVVAWGQVLQPINPLDIGALGSQSKFWVTGDSEKGYKLQASDVAPEDENEYNIPIALNWDYSDKIATAKTLVKHLQGQGNIPLKDLVYCRAGATQKISVLDEFSTYEVVGYEVKENVKYKKLEAIMDIKGVGKVRAQGNSQKFLIDLRPVVTPENPGKLETFEKVEKRAAVTYIQVNNRFTPHQDSSSFQAFDL
jgi:hypothetical protein